MIVHYGTISAIHYIDGEETLLAFNLVSASWPAYFVTFFSNKPKQQERAIFHKDWRSIQYDRDNPICITEHEIYYACVKAVSGNGLCQYAICMDCYDKNKPKRIRCNKNKSASHSNAGKQDMCCHRLCDLEVTRDPWWCAKAVRHTAVWEGRVSGCISCEREFLKVGGRG